MKNTLTGMISIRPTHTFFTECDTGSWIWQQDRHEHIRYFELLIDALSEILIEMWQFKNLTYLCPGDHQWRHEHVKHNLHNYASLTCTCKILFVWHQLFINKSSARHRDKHTNAPIITQGSDHHGGEPWCSNSCYGLIQDGGRFYRWSNWRRCSTN